MSKIQIITMLFILTLSVSLTVQGADCADRVPSERLNDPSQWYSLELFTAAIPLNSDVHIRVQDIATTSTGNINNDFYAITIERGTYSAQSLLNEIRRGLSLVIFGVSSTDAKPNYQYSLNYYNQRSRSLWDSDSPKGALMSFTLALIPVPLAEPLPYRGSVLLSCISNTSFILSTVMTPNDGWHPVSGNRSFGVSQLPDGRLQIWTKAADRAVSMGVMGVPHSVSETARENTFREGAKVWERLLRNLEYRYHHLHPRDKVEFSVRRPYSLPRSPAAPEFVGVE